jgi:putative ATP-dependent endonuclease of the OLD family
MTVSNFRSIQDIDIDLTPTCALVGANNAGKTNVLLALSRVLTRGWVNSSTFDDDLDRFQRDPDKDVLIRVTFDEPLQYVNFKGAPPALIYSLEFTLARYKIGEKKGQPRIEQRCLDVNGKLVQVLASAPKKGQVSKYKPMTGAVPREVMDMVPLIYIDTRRSLRDALPSNRYSMLRQLLDDVNADFNDPSQTIEVKRPAADPVTMPRAERWTQLMAAAMKLLRTPEFESLETDINESALRQLGFNPAKDQDELQFFFGPRESSDFYRSLELLVKEHGFEINAQQLGEGFQNALVMAILEAYEKRRKKGAILLIEEPEMFLHPQTQRSLFRTLTSIGEHNQVIYTTHSSQMLSVPDYGNVMLVRRVSGATTAVRSSLPSNADRKLRLERAFDPSRNELFFARKVLIVEGDTERLALPQWAKKLELDLDRSGSSIIEVGGKNNLLLFAEVAASFGIPTGVVYDRDSPDVGDAEKNKALNKELAGFDMPAAGQRSWQLDPAYEGELRSETGEAKYQELCQRYPGMSKPLRQKQIAADPEVDVPFFVEEILTWLADT